jgi:hypothetical protein
MSSFNESKQIAFSMYNLVFFLVLAIVAVVAFDTVAQRVASYVLRSVALLLGISITTIVLFAPKVVATLRTPAEASNVRKVGGAGAGSYGGSIGGTNTGGKTSSLMSSISSDDVEGQLEKSRAQCSELKAQIEELKREKNALQNKVERLQLVIGKDADVASEDGDATESSSTDDVKKSLKPESRKSEKKSKRKSEKKHEAEEEATESSSE